jgi:glutathione synthase/RimK-type ligase-like ATP-grasp enzyme
MKKQFLILVGRDGRPSMKKVYSQMTANGNLVVRRNPPGKSGYLRIYSDANVNKFQKQSLNELSLAGKVVIRWGNRIEAETDKSSIVYNKSESIAKATNKKLTREIFIKEKVRCPLLVTPQTVKDADFPIIARPATHAKGKNFIVLKTRAEFTTHHDKHANAGWYYSQFINKTREFRVHCAHGKVLAIMEKAKGGDNIAWNRAQTGEPFRRISQKEYPFSVCFQALKACKVLGLDFAGVDVLEIMENGKPQAYVVEANTSPTLNSSDFVSTQYARYFDWLGRSETRREHWDFTKFKAAESFSWKQDQLTAK